MATILALILLVYQLTRGVKCSNGVLFFGMHIDIVLAFMQGRVWKQLQQ